MEFELSAAWPYQKVKPNWLLPGFPVMVLALELTRNGFQ
jgi:hypothetical protein